MALWVDAALWGQVDVPLCLLLMAAGWSLLHDRLTLAGVFAGLALAMKLQAVFALPFLLIFAWNRYGWQRSLGAAVVGLVTVALLSLPFLLHSEASRNGLIASYTGAVGLYTTRSTEAYNIWHLSIGFDRMVRHLPSEVANADNLPYIGFLTARQIGLAAFFAAFLPIVWRMGKNPSPKTLLWSIALAYITLFMLCTEMHERYILPGVMFLAMLYGISPGAKRLYPFWSVTTLANTLMSFVLCNRQALNTVEVHRHGLEYILWRGGSTTLAIMQIVMFVLLYRAFWRETEPLSDSS